MRKGVKERKLRKRMKRYEVVSKEKEGEKESEGEGTKKK